MRFGSFVIRCKNFGLCIFVTFGYFGSIKTEYNGVQAERHFEPLCPTLCLAQQTSISKAFEAHVAPTPTSKRAHKLMTLSSFHVTGQSPCNAMSGAKF